MTTPTTPPSVRGFVCPRCTDGTGRPVVLGVVKTIKSARDVVTRRRKCPVCRTPVPTVERPAAGGGADR